MGDIQQLLRFFMSFLTGGQGRMPIQDWTQVDYSKQAGSFYNSTQAGMVLDILKLFPIPGLSDYIDQISTAAQGGAYTAGGTIANAFAQDMQKRMSTVSRQTTARLKTVTDTGINTQFLKAIKTTNMQQLRKDNEYIHAQLTAIVEQMNGSAEKRDEFIGELNKLSAQFQQGDPSKTTENWDKLSQLDKNNRIQAHKAAYIKSAETLAGKYGVTKQAIDKFRAQNQSTQRDIVLNQLGRQHAQAFVNWGTAIRILTDEGQINTISKDYQNIRNEMARRVVWQQPLLATKQKQDKVEAQFKAFDKRLADFIQSPHKSGGIKASTLSSWYALAQSSGYIRDGKWGQDDAFQRVLSLANAAKDMYNIVGQNPEAVAQMYQSLTGQSILNASEQQVASVARSAWVFKNVTKFDNAAYKQLSQNIQQIHGVVNQSLGRNEYIAPQVLAKQTLNIGAALSQATPAGMSQGQYMQQVMQNYIGAQRSQGQQQIAMAYAKWAEGKQGTQQELLTRFAAQVQGAGGDYLSVAGVSDVSQLQGYKWTNAYMTARNSAQITGLSLQQQSRYATENALSWLHQNVVGDAALSEDQRSAVDLIMTQLLNSGDLHNQKRIAQVLASETLDPQQRILLQRQINAARGMRLGDTQNVNKQIKAGAQSAATGQKAAAIYTDISKNQQNTTAPASTFNDASKGLSQQTLTKLIADLQALVAQLRARRDAGTNGQPTPTN